MGSGSSARAKVWEPPSERPRPSTAPVESGRRGAVNLSPKSPKARHIRPKDHIRKDLKGDASPKSNHTTSKSKDKELALIKELDWRHQRWRERPEIEVKVPKEPHARGSFHVCYRAKIAGADYALKFGRTKEDCRLEAYLSDIQTQSRAEYWAHQFNHAIKGIS